MLAVVISLLRFVGHCFGRIFNLFLRLGRHSGNPVERALRVALHGVPVDTLNCTL